MAVKIRLARRGRKGLAMYDVIVADARSPRDGRFIEKLGSYNPNTNPATVDINNDRALHWIMNGALPTDTARTILSGEGIMLRKHLQVGVLKGAITQEQADKKFEDWKSDKEKQVQAKVDSLTQSKDAARKERLAAEAKVKEARAEAIRQNLAAAVEETREAIADADAKAEMGEELAEDVAEVEEAQEAAAEATAATEEAPEAEVKEEAPEAKAEEVKEAPEATAAPEAKAEEAPAEEVKEEPAEAKTEEAPEAEVKEEAPEAKAEEAEEKAEDSEEEEKKAE